MKNDRYSLKKIDREVRMKGAKYALKKYNRGSGILSFITDRFNKIAPERNPNINPPKVREFLNKVGNEKINSLQAVRKPIQTTVKNILNYVSLGTLKTETSKLGYDQLFHLRLVINDKYFIEKNEVIQAGIHQNSNDWESIDIPLNGKSFTIREALDNTSKYMGDNYGKYNAKTNNCQVFVLSILQANGYGNDESKNFIKQDTETLFNKMPSFIEKVSNVATNTASRINRLIDGEGVKPVQIDEEEDDEEINDPMINLKKEALAIVHKKSKPVKTEFLDSVRPRVKKQKGGFLPLLVSLASSLLG